MSDLHAYTYDNLTLEQQRRAIALLDYLQSDELAFDIMLDELREYMELTGWLEDE